MSIRAARYIQLGRETTAGTAVAATKIWRGTGVIDDQPTVVFPAEDIGYLSGVDRSYIPRYLSKISLDPVEATYEQLCFLLAMGVKNVYTGVADGVGTDKIYAYPLPTTAANSIQSTTIEAGDDQQEEEMEYCVAESIKLTGKAGEALMMSGSIFGRQTTPSTKTGALTLTAVEEILFSKGKLYIDAYSGTVGTTQKSSTFLEMDLDIKTGWFPRFTGDGQLYFTAARFSGVDTMEALLKIKFEHDATAVAEKATWRAQTSRLIRLLFEGSTVATPGTTYSKKTLLIDLAGRWEKFDKLDELDGNDIVEGTFRARYNSTAALFASLTVVNELTGLFT